MLIHGRLLKLKGKHDPWMILIVISLCCSSSQMPMMLTRGWCWLWCHCVVVLLRCWWCWHVDAGHAASGLKWRCRPWRGQCAVIGQETQGLILMWLNRHVSSRTDNVMLMPHCVAFILVNSDCSCPYCISYLLWLFHCLVMLSMYNRR